MGIRKRYFCKNSSFSKHYRKRKEMKTTNKLALALLVVFAISVVTSIPIATQAATTQQTYAISDAIPDKIGLGEETLLKCGITEALATQAYGWTGLTIKVVAPNGATETLGPFTTDSTGSTYTLYTPDQVGTYNLTTYFPQQEMPVNTTAMERGTTIYKGTVMLASEATSQLVVTEEHSQQYPSHSLPTEYWSRPIDPQLREWYSISGNWVARPDNSIAEYNADAPETAHVLWAKEMTTGGMTGGLWGEGQVPAASETGDAYEGKYANSVILNGVLYYNQFDQGLTNQIHAVDLHTGQELWVKNATTLSFGQILYFDSFNYDGVFTYLYSSVSMGTYPNTWTQWNAYDPFDGKWAFTFNNIPSGVQARGPSGELLIYQIDYRNGWMALWNSTLCGLQNSIIGESSYGSWGSQVQGRTFDASTAKCYSWNVTIPKDLTASTSFFSPILKVYPDRVVSVFFNQTKVRVWALPTDDITPTLTAKPATQQAITTLFDQWWNAPEEWFNGTNTLHYVGATNYVKDGVIGIWDKELTTHYGFSVETGKYLWATKSEDYLDAYGWGNAEHTWYYAYGKLYSVGVAGILYAYDLQTGETAWTYNLTDVYGEPVTGQNWWGWITLIADGKIYLGTVEHSAENPLPRGAPQVCVNASNGAELWRVNGMFRDTRWGGNGVIGDSIIATMDTYDQRVYAIGKGPTQLTASAGPKVTTAGSSVVVEGTVTDISPGTATTELALRFPNGVPAVSDASQSAWMLYVYKQFEQPTNATGVPVTISVVDANNNYRTIGSTTSDATGYYSYNWVPDIAGKYTVIATFGGSAAYYGSYAQTSFVVDAAASTPAPTQTPASVADTYFVPATVGIVVAILIVGVVLALLLLRKKP